MNKTSLVTEVAKRTTGNRTEVATVLNAAIDVIRQAVAKGEKVTLADFGTFAKVRRNKRTARNPRQPEHTVVVPARDVPSFTPGRRFKAEVAARRRRGKTTTASRRA